MNLLVFISFAVFGVIVVWKILNYLNQRRAEKYGQEFDNCMLESGYMMFILPKHLASVIHRCSPRERIIGMREMVPGSNLYVFSEDPQGFYEYTIEMKKSGSNDSSTLPYQLTIINKKSVVITKRGSWLIVK